MRKFLHNERKNINAAILNTARKKNLTPALVEKDLYVCYILDYLFNRFVYKNFLEFKGGTSLSKGYDLINRFSEDIDVVLKADVLNVNLEDIINLESKNKKSKQADELNRKAITFYQEKLIPILKRDLESELESDFNVVLDEKDLAIYIQYPSSFRNEYVKDSVKLEIGPLAAWTPCETKEISSFIAQEYPKLFETVSFPVLITKPVRTFWEKAVIMHQEANRVDGKVPMRYFRHYYDLYRMNNSFVKKEALNNIELLNEVRIFTITFYNRSWSRFEEAVPGTFKLYPNENSIPNLKKDYENMKQMIFGDSPSFEEVLSVIKKLEEEINDLGKKYEYRKFI